MEGRQLHTTSNPHLALRATKELVDFGMAQGWQPVILGRAPMIEEAIRLKDWLLMPAHEDTSKVPDRALRRVQGIYAAGLRPKGFVIAHEAPQVLPAGKAKPTPMPIHSVNIDDALFTLAKAVALTTSITAIAGLAIFSALLVGVATLDPILIAVTQDDYWIEIDRWDS